VEANADHADAGNRDTPHRPGVPVSRHKVDKQTGLDTRGGTHLMYGATYTATGTDTAKICAQLS